MLLCTDSDDCVHFTKAVKGTGFVPGLKDFNKKVYFPAAFSHSLLWCQQDKSAGFLGSVGNSGVSNTEMLSGALPWHPVLLILIFPGPMRVLAMAGLGEDTRMLDLLRSSQLKVSQGASCTCKEKGLYWACFLTMHAVGEQLCFLGTQINTCLGFWGQRAGFRRVIGDVLSHSSGQASSALLAPKKPELKRWAERQAGKFGGRRRRVGAAFVRMEITVSPIQSVALFPGDNCKTGLLVLKNS